MGALIGLLIIIVLSITIVRIGAVALELTGLTAEVASFQALSAFSGTGFTTSVSETIVSHPIRRKITRILILLGSAGFTSTVATFILTFVGQTGKGIIVRLGILLMGLIIIYFLTRSKFIYRGMKTLIMKALSSYSALKIFDFQEILGLSKGYTISRFQVHENSWMEGCRLKDLRVHSEGILILSISRIENGETRFIGVPTGDTMIHKGDILICYGREDTSWNLFTRRKGIDGDTQHQKESQKEKQYAEEREARGGYS